MIVVHCLWDVCVNEMILICVKKLFISESRLEPRIYQVRNKLLAKFLLLNDVLTSGNAESCRWRLFWDLGRFRTWISATSHSLIDSKGQQLPRSALYPCDGIDSMLLFFRFMKGISFLGTSFQPSRHSETKYYHLARLESPYHNSKWKCNHTNWNSVAAVQKNENPASSYR